jgi:hypothetical protein
MSEIIEINVDSAIETIEIGFVLPVSIADIPGLQEALDQVSQGEISNEIVQSMLAHEAEVNPHPQYTTESEVNQLIAASGSGQSVVLSVASQGQTSFTLPAIPAIPTRTQLFVNGVKYEFLQDYTIADYSLTWLGFGLMVSDRVHFYY